MATCAQWAIIVHSNFFLSQHARHTETAQHVATGRDVTTSTKNR